MHSNPHRPRSRTALAALALVVTAGLALAGCGASPDPASSGTASTRDTLVIALPSALTTSLDPRDGGSIRLDGSVQSAIYSSLTTINPELKVVGDLATEWKQSDDALSWEFTLRDDAKFENGDALDADVVAWNINNVITSKTGVYSTLLAVTTAEATDATHVVIHTSKPYLDLPRKLTVLYFIDPAWVDKGNNTKTTANASGPYSVVSYDPQSQVVLKRNDSYYGKAAQFENATYTVIPTAAGRLAALQAGEVDLSIVLEPQDLGLIKGNDKLVVGSVESNRAQMVRLNTRIAPFNDQRVREAVNYAIDKGALAKSVLGGLVKPLGGQVLNSLYSGFDPDLKAFPYDPDKAKKLLKEAGYDESNPLSFEIDVPTGAYVGVDLTVQGIQQQLADIGVTVNLNILDFTAWVKRVGEQPGALQSSFVGYSSNDNSNYQILSYFVSGFVQNHADDPAYDALVKDIDSATTEKDQIAATQKALEQAHKFVPVIWLYPQPQTYAYASDLQWTPRPDDWLRPQDVHLAK
jgi:peptide/nickel transport system substrate-binding protein